MTLAWRRLGQSPWLFAGPVVAAAIAFVWLPMAATLALSFFDWSLLKQEGTWRPVVTRFPPARLSRTMRKSSNEM